MPTELWSTSAPVQLRCASRNADCETVLVVVVLDLHDVVAGTEGPAETLDAMLTRRVQRILQLYVEGPGAEATPVHWAEPRSAEAIGFRGGLAASLRATGQDALAI